MIKATHLNPGTDEFLRILPRSQPFKDVNQIFNPTISSFPTDRQDPVESDKTLANFALTLNTATLADDLWIIKVISFTAGTNQFDEVLLGTSL